jgi:hypothetical protein
MGNPALSQEEQLTSWKSIADYLNCRPRTCIRWEKTLGLPVHRLEGAQKSRVFAYKSELDAWLQKKLQNGNDYAGEPIEAAGSKKAPLWLIMFAAASGLAVLAFLMIGPRLKTVPSPATDEAPRSTGPFDVYPGDIVTTEFLPEGKLRVWRKKNRSEFFVSWKMAPLRHTSLAIGDLDGDPDSEVVAPGYCRDFFEVNGQRSSRIRFFLNAYKRGIGNWWKTTFFDTKQSVFEPENFEFTEIDVGDIDGASGNEIVLATAGGLSVFHYDPAAEELRLLDLRTTFIEQTGLYLKGLRIADLDGDGDREVVIIGNEWSGGTEVDNKGWLVVLSWNSGHLAVIRTVELNGSVSPQSLRMGEVIAGAGAVAVFPIYRLTGAGRMVIVAGWNAARGFVFEFPIGKDPEIPYRPIHLDVGDLMDRPGDEVVIATNAPNELICCFWNGFQLSSGPKYTLFPTAELANVFVSPANTPGNKLGRILTCGSISATGKQGTSYIEVIDYGNGFIPVWLRTGGELSDIKISYAAFGK